MIIKANLLYKPGNFQMDDCQIEKVVELSRAEFGRLKLTPLMAQPFIRENKDCMFSRDGVMHCLLALEQGGKDGVLIEAEGHDYALYAAYIPGMRDIVIAQMEQAADFVIQAGTENANGGSWCVSFNKRPCQAYGCACFDELNEQFGLTIQDGNGFDILLSNIVCQRPEVISAQVNDSCITMELYPEYCQWLSDTPKAEQPNLSLKDLLPLLKSGPIFLCHEEAEQSVLAENLRRLTGAGQENCAALLNARVSEICETPEGTEVVLTDVDPEELVRFNEAYDAFLEAEQAMGPAMG